MTFGMQKQRPRSEGQLLNVILSDPVLVVRPHAAVTDGLIGSIHCVAERFLGEATIVSMISFDGDVTFVCKFLKSNLGLKSIIHRSRTLKVTMGKS